MSKIEKAIKLAKKLKSEGIEGQYLITAVVRKLKLDAIETRSFEISLQENIK